MRLYYTLLLLFVACSVTAQQLPKELPAHRTTATFKIDGELNEAAWKEARPATDFVEWRPNAGKPETNKTLIYMVYDNTSLYIGGYCYEKTKDSISRELIGRDKVGVNDFVGVIIDTYNDKINGVGFYVTPYGEQYDAKYSGSGSEDDSWNAVWDSEAKIHADGWSFEMRIPYSALRFVSRENQTWGLNITRRRNKTGQQFMWNPIDPNKNGFINQEGLWTGIGKIDAPIRLSLSPYLSGYINHYKPNEKPTSSSINGGMDVKYGISESFTLDMTLVPDFGQVRSDNQVLNLSPFEVRFQENRPFFTEGTELFNKGNLFYSRRIGATPLHFGKVYDIAAANGETVVVNPQASKLINASKISGRTKKGLGVGFFNAITKPMFAELESSSKSIRKVETSPLTNYNIFVLDQTMKNNSSVSLINTSTVRYGNERDANVTAAMFDINNKTNVYNVSGKFSVSQVTDPVFKTAVGYAHSLGFAKTGGRWNFQLGQDITDAKYDINDMGILFNNNSIDHYAWMGYKWIKPTSWYNNIRLNVNAYHSQLYRKFPFQKVNSNFQAISTNVNVNGQLKNLWFVGFFLGYVPEGNDFYEPRRNDGIDHRLDQGWSFRSTERVQMQVWFETNSAKKYSVGANYFVGIRKQFASRNHQFNMGHKYRFNDKLSVGHDFYFNPFGNDAGFFTLTYQKDASGRKISDGLGGFVVEDMVFSRRDRFTAENVLNAKYNFSKRSGITFRARHYWSKVKVKELYDLQPDGSLRTSVHTEIPKNHQNFNIFNIDATYTLQFAPGSFINIVWKDEGSLFNREIEESYFKNFNQTISQPQNNNLSVKIIYFLDYLDIKKWRKKGN